MHFKVKYTLPSFTKLGPLYLLEAVLLGGRRHSWKQNDKLLSLVSSLPVYLYALAILVDACKIQFRSKTRLQY